MESNNKKRKEKQTPVISRQSSSGSTSAEIQAPSGVSAHSQALFLQKIHEGSEAVNRGDFHTTIQAYTEAISLDPTNHILYTNRSTAFAKIQQFQKSLLDAKKSRELNPKWAKAYIREGTALQQLGQHADALAAFASGLAQDTNNANLLSGLKDAALKSPLKEKLEYFFQKMQQLALDKSPFVIISVIGQELLQAGHYHASTQMLEAALKIGTCSLKLRSSVVSALSSAYWGLGNIDNAISYMQKDLQVAKHLGDVEGQCRSYGNLGSAYFSKGHYKEALSHDRFQLVLAMRLKDRQTATVALSRLGHVYTAIGDYPNALQSHKQCVLLLKQNNDKLAEAREIGNVGAVYLAMGNFDTAVECHLEHLKIAKSLKNSIEEARAFSNLGSAYHYKRNYEKAILYHKQVLKIAEQKCDKSLEARAYAGLGHAARCMQDYGMSKTYHEKQLDNALQTRDKVAEGRACANLGIIFHQLGEYEAALKLHKVHLSIAKDLGDRASQGRALGNIGNAYCALNKYDQAIKYHKQELAISMEVNDRHSEGSTHGNLAVAYQTLKMYDSAHQHYVAHLNISRELKDSQSEARAVCNLGNFHSSHGEYTNSIPYYEQYLMLSQELHDSEGEAKACFCLGYAHFALGNFQESVRYYEQDLSIAQELKNQLSIARAYCNLGLAHKALNNFTEALDCQKKCLNLMTTLKNVKGKFRSLGNIGDVLLKTGDANEAIKFYNQQLQLAKQSINQDMLAKANGALGAAHRTIAQYDKALGFHTQELSLRQDMSDLKGECRAHGNLGSVHMCLGKYMNAYKCYEEQLEKSRELPDSAMEANACGNLAITKMNMGNFEEAIGLFEQQLAILEQVHGNNATFDKGRAFGNLGDCYEVLGDFDESIKCHEQYLAIAQSSGQLSDQDRAYRGLGNAHRSVGNLQQALVCFEKRLVVAHELNSAAAKASAYGELGCLHSLLGNFEQAISCLQHQLAIAREMEDSLCEGDAACGLGGVYQQMGEYEKALEYHEMDLKIAEKKNNTACQCRAYGNLGLSYESLGEYSKAIKYQEQHLSIAAQMNDRVAKTLAYSSLGRVHHALSNHQKAVEYLRQGLQIAEQLGRMEDEAKIRHRLGLALWGNGDHNECQLQLYKASELFESIRRDAQFNSEYKLSLFDLQTACYQALQRVLVSLDRHQEALVVAERACTRAFIDLLMERQAGSDGFYGNHVTDPPPITSDQIMGIVQSQKSMVLYFSVAAGFLYGWLLTPRDGIVKYHVTSMTDVENEVDGGDNISMKSGVSYSACSLLENMVGQIHEFMGIDTHTPSNVYRGISRSMNLDSESTSDMEDHWEQHMEELGDKLNAENDRTGFLRIVNRNHLFNSSNYSLGSLLSLNPSVNASFPGNAVNRRNSMKSKFGNKSAIAALYQLLIEPFEEVMKEKTEEAGSNPSDLILVLQGDLYLIPFSVLRKDQTMEYLFERFNLIVVPSLTSLQSSDRHKRHGRPVIDSSGAVVVGNPKLTPAICQHWHLHDIPASEYEAQIIGEILTARPLIGHEATKVAVLNQIEQVEVIHFATHISWKLSSVILSPGEVPSHPTRFPTIDSDDSASDISSFDGPSLAEYLLTAADILNLKLHAKLVVLSAGYTDDRAGRINTDGVVGLTRSLLSAGAQCVLYCLWPIPDQASKLLMRTLYLGLQDGKHISQALTFALKTVQSTKQYSHPSNWGGWVLIGQDVKLSSKVAQMGHAICELLQNPSQCREAMRVLLHLIEKSLQRIHQGLKNSMYTTAQSIENKVGGLPGWKDLLQAVGFRFEPSLNSLPPAVFFPQSDPGDRLTQASASLQSLLGLPQGCLQALPKFFHNYEAGEVIIRVMRDILSKIAAKDTNVDVKVNVKLWRVSGCHEFLASLSMDLVEVGDDEITLRLGKQANKRHLQFALQSLVTIFDTQEAPTSLYLDSSSSLESLSSSHSGSTSTSNFSKGSTPPLSPRGKKKSLFNPAEMEKMRIRNSRMSQGGLAGRKISSRKSPKLSVTDPATCLQYQNQIKYMYGNGGSMSRQYGNDVSVMALSDSDTTASPTLGNSANSYKIREMQTDESYSLSFDARSDKSGKSDSNKSELSDIGDKKWHDLTEIISSRTSVSVDSSVESCQETDNTFIHVEDLSFKRNEDNLTSGISNDGSVNQGIQAKKDYRERNSDVSDMSVESDTHLTMKQKWKIDNFIHLTDESGIASEMASSNQSESSQQSAPTNFRFNPTEIAKKIMNDVSEHKIALDSFQKLSIIQSQTESNFLRSEYEKKLQSLALTSDKIVVGKSESSQACGNQVGSNPTMSKIAILSGNKHSAFTSPSYTSFPPSNVTVKSALQTSTSNFQNLYANTDNLKNILNSKLLLKDNVIEQSKVTMTLDNAVMQQPMNNVFTKMSSTGVSTTMSCSSFRPSTIFARAENVSNALQYRPDSITSSSSYCSTSSSMQSVIYKPHMSDTHTSNSCVPDSLCADPYDSSTVPGLGLVQPVTQIANVYSYQKDNVQATLIQKRNSSPALSSSSSGSGLSGRQKKRVSFYDSDTPSPLDSSASSNMLSYFEMKRSISSNIPSTSHQSPNSSLEIDGLGITAPQTHRPPPPSYQYAIKNSQYMQNKSEENNTRAISNRQLSNQSNSSGSSLNNSLDDINRIPPHEMSPRKYGAGTSFQNHTSIRNQTSIPAASFLPLQQQQMKYDGNTVTQNIQYINTNLNNQFQNPSIQSANLPMSQSHQFSPVNSPIADRQAPSSAPQIMHRGIAPILASPNNVMLRAPVLLERQSESRLQMLHENQGPMSLIREQVPFHLQSVSNLVPVDVNILHSAQKGSNSALTLSGNAVLRHPLCNTESRVPRQQYFPPQPTHFQNPSESDSGNIHKIDTDNNMGQTNSNLSQSMDLIDQYNNLEPSNLSKYTLQNYEFKANSSAQVLNNHAPTNLKEITNSSTNQMQVQQINHCPATKQLTAISVLPNRNEQPVRRILRVAPSRINSLENVEDININGVPSGQQRIPDNVVNGQNSRYGDHGQNIYSASFVPKGQNAYPASFVPKRQNVYPQSFVPIGQYYSVNNEKISTLNGFLRDKPVTVSHPVRSTPVQPINVQTLPINTTNGNISNVQSGQSSFGHLMQVGADSDKRYPAKTNVIQASKC